jgi:hypothetical protein
VLQYADVRLITPVVGKAYVRLIFNTACFAFCCWKRARASGCAIVAAVAAAAAAAAAADADAAAAATATAAAAAAAGSVAGVLLLPL